MKKFYTPREVAEILAYPYSTFYEMQRRGDTAHLKPVITRGAHRDSFRYPRVVIDSLANGEAA